MYNTSDSIKQYWKGTNYQTHFEEPSLPRTQARARSLTFGSDVEEPTYDVEERLSDTNYFETTTEERPKKCSKKGGSFLFGSSSSDSALDFMYVPSSPTAKPKQITPHQSPAGVSTTLLKQSFESPLVTKAATDQVTPGDLKELDKKVDDGKFNDLETTLSPGTQEVVRRAKRTLKGKEVSGEKKTQVAKRITEKVVQMHFSHMQEEARLAGTQEVNILKNSPQLVELLGTLVPHMSNPENEDFSFVSPVKSIESFSTTPSSMLSPSRRNMTFPFVDDNHLIDPYEGFHWIAPGEQEPAFNPPSIENEETGVYAGNFLSPKGEKKFSTFFPKGVFSDIEQLKKFILESRILARAENRVLKHGIVLSEGKEVEIYFENYLQLSDLVIRSSFPVFRYIKLEAEDAIYEIISDQLNLHYQDIASSILEEVNAYIRSKVKKKASPIKYCISHVKEENKRYIFDMANKFTSAAFGLEKGLFVEIGHEALAKILAKVERFCAQDVMYGLLKNISAYSRK
ncbi:MAG: hypothetical protein FJZ56_04380 [Chlamydiae bacterium]|nr:hypothetical protein [Chlamydiota bacterium]